VSASYLPSGPAKKPMPCHLISPGVCHPAQRWSTPSATRNSGQPRDLAQHTYISLAVASHFPLVKLRAACPQTVIWKQPRPPVLKILGFAGATAERRDRIKVRDRFARVEIACRPGKPEQWVAFYPVYGEMRRTLFGSREEVERSARRGLAAANRGYPVACEVVEVAFESLVFEGDRSQTVTESDYLK
jgi:hypothetical protein